MADCALSLSTLFLCFTAGFHLTSGVISQPFGIRTCVQLCESLTEPHSPPVKVLSLFCMFSNVAETPASTGGLLTLHMSNTSEKRFKIILSKIRGFEVVKQKTEEDVLKGYKLLTKGKTKLTYKYHHEYNTWNKALAVCNSEGGTLLKLHSRTRLFLFAKMQESSPSKSKKSPWIGLSFLKKHRTWAWTDGQPDNAPAWNARLPPPNRSKGELCGVGLNDGSGIHDRGKGSLAGCRCNSKHWFICEKAGNQ